jgi:hypothetical protein
MLQRRSNIKLRKETVIYRCTFFVEGWIPMIAYIGISILEGNGKAGELGKRSANHSGLQGRQRFKDFPFDIDVSRL